MFHHIWLFSMSRKTVPALLTLHFLILSKPAAVFVAFFLWSTVSSYLSCVILFKDIMDLNLLSLGTLVLAAPCCVVYARRHWIRCRFDTDGRVFQTVVRVFFYEFFCFQFSVNTEHQLKSKLAWAVCSKTMKLKQAMTTAKSDVFIGL